MINEKLDSRTNNVFELRIAKNLKKDIKDKIIILFIFAILDGSIDTVNNFKSP